MGLGQSHVDSHGHHHVQHSDPATTPEKFCTTLLANATCGDLMDQCFDLFKGHNTTGQVVHEPQPMWQVWTLGLFMVTIISGSAACGVLILPCLSQRVYNKVLTFFVALGVGTLSGSAVFHLLPEAFHLTETEGYMAKACMVIAGIYLFFLVDKFITIMIGCRKKNKKVVDAKAALPEAPSQDVEEAVNHTHNHNHGHSHDGDSTIGSVAWLVIFSDGLHNFIDGLGIGVAFQQDIWVGLSISIAVLSPE
uniref:Zinc transporter ZIP8 n=1 Tax=Steinernema glaseri TaxID=37863 RepID=A0A1I7Z2E0_9BILA